MTTITHPYSFGLHFSTVQKKHCTLVQMKFENSREVGGACVMGEKFMVKKTVCNKLKIRMFGNIMKATINYSCVRKTTWGK